ncbi:MAG: right-handed parallel beta-helix repeat-containing protein [bacterium]
MNPTRPCCDMKGLMGYKKRSNGMKKLLALVVFGMGFLTQGAMAVDLYVPGSYTTIQLAIDAANPGDRVIVSTGTYNEAVYINKNITLIGAAQGVCTITASGLGDTNTVTFDGTNAKGTITGFTITGATSTVWPYGSGIFGTNSANPTIIHNTISGNRYGIYCDSSSPAITNNTISWNSYGIFCNSSFSTITNNTISGNTRYGISCHYYPSPQITNNTILENTCDGIDCDYSSPTITNNTISGNGWYGIYFFSSSPQITNNIIVNNRWYGIYRASGNPTMNYNDIWNNSSGNYGNCSPGPNDISLDPQFISLTDFHFQSNSPCIDFGSNTAIGTITTDKDGNPRIVNGIVDMGAYEFQGTPTVTGSVTVYDSLGQIIGTYTAIQQGINACPIGGIVSVSPGGYTGTVYLNKTLTLIGAGADICTITSSGLGNYGIITFDSNNANGTITGFTITGASNSGICCHNGANPTIIHNTISGNSYGINCYSSSPNITNNTISGNSYHGICCYSSSPTIINNTISGNSDRGISCSSPNITNNTISGNSYGIYCDNSSSPNITNNTISGNDCGIWCFSFSNITNNTISGNDCGIWCFSSSGTISNNTIAGNKWDGIYCHASSPTISNNTIAGHSRYGIYSNSSFPTITNNTISVNGCGIYCLSSSPAITNNTISGNSDDGISCEYSSSPTITNNTISGNSEDGIYCDSSSPAITNNIITENGTTSTSYYGIYKYSGNPIIDYNCVFRNGQGGNNNYYHCSAGLHDISLDPQFIGNGDYHLGSGSLCIDAGSNTAPGIYGTSTDKDGNPRIINGIVDMGAYEYQDTPPSFSGSIFGTVTDTNGDPISGALVKVISLAKILSLTRGEAITSDNGTYTIENLPFGTYAIRASCASYYHSYRGGIRVDGPILKIELRMLSTETTTIYVDKSSTTGIENGSQQYPYSTIQRGVDICPPEATVSVTAGTYTEPVYIDKGIALIGNGTPTIKPPSGNNGVTFDGTFTDNVSISGFWITGASYGIYCNNGAEPVITHNTISGNNDGIYCGNSSPTITNNTILANSKYGIYCQNSSSPAITNNTISGNKGSGISCCSSSPTITNNTIAENSWNGISCYGSSPTITHNTILANSKCGISCDTHSSPAITHNIISGNRYDGIDCGWYSSPAITNNTISGNSYHGISCSFSSSPAITNNTISGNSDYGISCEYSSSPTITNNTISGNSKDGIFCWNSSLNITNNIIVQNGTSNDWTYGIRNGGDPPGTPTIDYNDVWENGDNGFNNYSGCSAGPNDISDDPQFAESDYRLGSSSPCIDAGSNSAVPSWLTTDKDGNPRIINGIVDIGAYEFQIILPPAILSISPSKGGNAGQVTVKIIGRGFKEGAIPKLKRGVYEITGISIVYTPNRLTTTFDLTNKEPGIWDVVVENLEGTLVLPGGFTIEQGGEPKLWVEIVGREQIQVGREQTYWIRYGNAGNLDAHSVLLLLRQPRNVNYEVNVPLAEPTLEQIKPEDALDSGSKISLWFIITHVPAGSIDEFPLKLTTTQRVDIPISASIFMVEQSILESPARNRLESEFLELQILKSLQANSEPQRGDMVFRLSPPPGGTGHVGIYVEDANGNGFVIDHNTDDFVKVTPFAQWKKGEGGYVGHAHTPDWTPNIGEKIALEAWNMVGERFPYLSPPIGPFKNCVEFANDMYKKAGLQTWEFSTNPPSWVYEFFTLFSGSPKRWPEEEKPFWIQPPSRNFDLWRILEEALIEDADKMAAIFKRSLKVVISYDPNDKAGPSGFGENKWVSPEQTFQYLVYFENALPTATAYAQEIKIADQLSPNLDTSTLVFNSICIGDRIINLPEDSQQISTSTIISVGTWSGGTPETDTVKLNIQASLSATGTIQIKLEGRTLGTNELTDLLPPNSDPPNGEGWVSFTIKPKSNLSSGTQIKNKASIVFDTNDPMDTPEVFNTIDSGIPTSYVKPLPAISTSTSFNLEWQGSDDLNGSGIRNYTIYCSDNESPYATIYVATSTGAYTYTGEYHHRYRFYSRASDNVGNLEAIPESPDCEILLIPEGIRIEADKRAIPIFGTTSLYCFAKGTESLFATWTLSGNIGTLSSHFGTSTIFYATQIGIGTITAFDGTSTAQIPIVVGECVDEIRIWTGTLTATWGTATARFGTSTREVYLLPIGTVSSAILQSLTGNIGIGMKINAFGTSATEITGTLTTPVQIMFNYDETVLGNIDERTLMLYLSSDGNLWKLVVDSNRDADANIVYGTITHLSFVAPAGKSKITAASDLTGVFVYPNPCYASRGQQLHFKRLTAQCTIKVFNIVGELVKEIEHNNGTDEEVWTNPREVASGVYIYLIKNEQGQKAIGKLGIIK